MTKQTAIDRLMWNDSDGTWDECQTVEELRAGLVEAIKTADEETAAWYAKILKEVEG